MTILVVDDTPHIADLVRFYVRRLNPPMDVIETDSCVKALRVFENELTEIACVLMDQRLPGAEGTDCVKELRSMNFDGPIIMLTGHLDSQTVSKAFQSGADDFVMKDVMATELATAIELAIRRRQELADIRKAYAHRLSELHEVYDVLDKTVSNVKRYLNDIDDNLKR